MPLRRRGMYMFPPVFNALYKEASFTKEILAIGITQLRKCQFSTHGFYFQSFTCLSTGLERIGKLCILLNYYIENNGRFPEWTTIKNIGHDLSVINKNCHEIKNHRNIEHIFLNKLDAEIHCRILNILTKYAKGDRYSNIDFLSNNTKSSDSVKEWYKNVDMYIFENFVTDRYKKKILTNAIQMHDMLASYSTVAHLGVDGESIDNIFEASKRAGICEIVAPYRQISVIDIVRFYSELLIKLGHQACMLEKQEIPTFSEIFAIFVNENSMLRHRKTFEKP